MAAVTQTRPRWRPRHPSGDFGRFFLRRLVALVLLCLGITLVAFVLTNLVPSNPAAANLGDVAAANPAAVAAYNKRNGLDRPLPVRYVVYLEHLVHGDLGTSLHTGLPVSHDLETYIPATIELGLFAVLIGVVFGITAGVASAVWHNRLPDHGLRLLALIGISMPVFWIALIFFYVFFFRLGWLPGNGRLDPGVVAPPRITGLYTVDGVLAGQWSVTWDAFRHLVLPAVVLSMFSIALLTRYTRSAVLEVLGNDYVRAARAKGLLEKTVIVRYVLRAAFASIITVVGLVFANVLAGAILVEQIFGWPGMGQYAYQSAVAVDLPAVVGTCLFVAVVYVVVNFVVDVLYGVIDPRIRLG